MGQACCRPAKIVVNGDTHDQYFGKLHAKSNYNTTENDDEDEDDWWDAASIGSMHSAMSTLDDALEQMHDVLDIDLSSFDEDTLLAAKSSGGHLVPKCIEDAACSDGGVARSPSKVPRLDLSSILFPKTPPTPHSWRSRLKHKHHEKNALQKIDQVKHLVSIGRILDASEKLKQLASLLSLSDLTDLAMHSDEFGIDILSLQQDILAVHNGLAELESSEGYMISRNDSLKVLYRHEKNGTCHSLKFEATFSHPVSHILSIAHEWDLIPTWNRFTLEAIKLAEPSIFESFVYGAQWMIKPFKPMQSVIRARGFDLADTHRSLLILINDANIDELPKGHAPLPKEFNSRRLVNFLPGSCLILRPLPVSKKDGTQQTEAHFVVHVDPHIRFVPQILVNFVLGILAPYIYNQINKVLENAFVLDSEYTKRIRDQPLLYGMVDDRMAEFANELNA